MNLLRDSQINLGPLLINTSLLYILIGIGAGITLLSVITKKDKTSRKFSSDIITNFFLIVILTWKLLPIFLAPGDIISNPVSILYTSGGSVGIGLGAGLGIIYLGIKLFLFWKQSVGEKDFLPLRDVLKPVVVFFVSATIVSSSLFFVSFLVRNGDSGFDNVNENRALRAPGVGEMAVDFDLRNIDGEIVSLVDYRGKWIILNFWASWCPPCKAELPTLNRFYKNMDKDKVVLLGINATGTERSGNSDVISYVSAFARDGGIDFPVLLDLCGNTGPCVSTVYGAGNLPTTVVISPEGVITKIKTGVVDSFWLRSVVN
jgi:peroxiredoxin